MAPFRKAPAVEGVDLLPGERALASAVLGAGVTVAATTLRLIVLRPDTPVWSRAWHEVDAVAWERDDRVLAVVTVDGAALTVELDEKEHLQLAQVVRERVQASLVTWQAVAVPGGRVRVAVRKGPEGLMLQEIPDPGVATDGVEARSRIDRARREVASSVGAEPSTLGGPEHL